MQTHSRSGTVGLTPTKNHSQSILHLSTQRQYAATASKSAVVVHSDVVGSVDLKVVVQSQAVVVVVEQSRVELQTRERSCVLQ